MNTIDERIVEMRFDNKQFESGVQTSLKSLDSLKKGLDLDESAKSLSNLSKAGKTFSLGNLASAVDSIADRFSAMGIVGVTALERIANSAISAGTQLVRSLTIAPITTGFQEYETKMNAITTILTNTQDKGSTLEDVNKTLAELNEYADQTIYNFAEMTRNIGTFTAAGVDLETSAKAIKGIANLAAGSGSNAQQASSAMYQLSQALAAGRVTLQDWNSVVNAGMGGQLFQNALKETAKQMGIVVDESVSFRDSISASGGNETWLTSDVLIKTLEKFADDKTLIQAATEVKTFTQLFDTMAESVQSGWATSWEYIVGTKDEAAKTLTALNNAFGELIGPSTDARNAMLEFWHDNGGRDALINGLTNAFKGLMSVITPIGKAFESIFPPMTGKQLVEISKNFEELTSKFKLSEATIQNIERTFKGIFAALDIGRQAVSAFITSLANVIGYILPAGNGLLGLTANIGDFIVKIDEAVKSGQIFEKIFGGIENVIKSVADVAHQSFGVIQDAFEALTSIDTANFTEFVDKIQERFKPLSSLGKLVGAAFVGIAKIFEKLAPIFINLGNFISDAIDKIVESVENSDFTLIGDIFNTGVMATLLVGIKKFFDSLSDVADGAGDFLGGLTDILDGVKGSLEAWQSSLKAATLLKIAGAIAILAASLFTIAMIDSEKLTGSLASISLLFAELFASMSLFTKINGADGAADLTKLGTAMITLSTAVLILSNAVKTLGGLEWDALIKGLIGVSTLVAVLSAAAKALSKSSDTLIKGSVGIIAFAGAIRILSESVIVLGNLDIEQLTKGLIGVGILCNELALFFAAADFDNVSIRTGTGLILLATSVRILAESVKAFGNLNVEQLAKGLGSVGAILLEVAAFTKLTGNAKHVISTATGMTILGASMLIFAQAISKMGSMPLEQIAFGLMAMGGALTEVTLVMNLLPKNMVGKAAGMLGVAAALIILADALKKMGGMNWTELGIGLAALAGSLTILAVALHAMNGALAGAAAMLVVSASLAVFVPALLALTKLSLPELGVGLLALAGAFAVVGVAGALLTPLAPTLLALAAAIALFGVGIAAVGAGVLAFSAGLSALAVAGTAGAAALVLIVSSLISLIPTVLIELGKGLVGFVAVIADSGKVIVEAFTTLIVSICDAIIEAAPKIGEAVFTLITTFVGELRDNMPMIVGAGFDIIISLMEGMRDNIESIVVIAIQIATNFIDGVASQLPRIAESGVNLIISFLDTLGETVRDEWPRVSEAFVNLGKNIIQGIIDGWFAQVDAIGRGITQIGNSIINGFKEVLGIHSPSVRARDEVGRYIVEGIAEGITEDMSAEEAAEKKAQNIVDAFQKEIDKFDLDINTAELKNQLFEAQGGADLGDAEKAAAEMELINEKMRLQEEKIKLYQGEYDVTVENFGKDSEKAQEAYNKLLQSQIDAAELANELHDVQEQEAERIKEVNEKNAEAAEANREAYQRYIDYLIQNEQTLKEMGYTIDEIEAAARQRSGYNPNVPTTTAMVTDVQTSVESAMGAVQTAYQSSAQDTFGALTSNFEVWGSQYAAAIGTGLQNGSTQVNESITKLMDACVKTMQDSEPKWNSAASYLIEGFAQAIRQYTYVATQAVSVLATSVYQTASRIWGIHSPSKAFAELGRYSVEGLNLGFNKYAYLADDAVANMATNAVDRFGSIVSRISDVINSDVDLQPRIRPVLDLEDIRTDAKKIPNLISANGLRVSGVTTRVAQVSMRSGSLETPSDVNSKKPQQTIYQFTQNNYSPKSLSRLEIYRQTKNQFSALKGVTGR